MAMLPMTLFCLVVMFGLWCCPVVIVLSLGVELFGVFQKLMVSYFITYLRFYALAAS
jgi:hypothetical protein